MSFDPSSGTGGAKLTCNAYPFSLDVTARTTAHSSRRRYYRWQLYLNGNKVRETAIQFEEATTSETYLNNTFSSLSSNTQYTVRFVYSIYSDCDESRSSGVWYNYEDFSTALPYWNISGQTLNWKTFNTLGYCLVPNVAKVSIEIYNNGWWQKGISNTNYYFGWGFQLDNPYPSVLVRYKAFDSNGTLLNTSDEYTITNGNLYTVTFALNPSTGGSTSKNYIYVPRNSYLIADENYLEFYTSDSTYIGDCSATGTGRNAFDSWTIPSATITTNMTITANFIVWINYFYWDGNDGSLDNDIIYSGGSVANMTYERWNTLNETIYRIDHTYTYNTKSQGDRITASDFMTAYNGIAGLANHGTLPTLPWHYSQRIVLSGDIIYASYLNGNASLKSALNEAISHI